MNIYDHVMQMETEDEALYRQFAKSAPNAGMKKIFNWLADQEKKHYETFEKMKNGAGLSVADDAVLRDTVAIFEDWKKGSAFPDADLAQADVYRKALETEKKSAALYEEHAKTAQSEEQKEAWLRIAAEEKAHEEILENIIEFITQPEQWAENAEFSSLTKDY